MPDGVLSAFCQSSQQSYEVRTAMTPILQMRKPRHWRFKCDFESDIGDAYTCLYTYQSMLTSVVNEWIPSVFLRCLQRNLKLSQSESSEVRKSLPFGVGPLNTLPVPKSWRSPLSVKSAILVGGWPLYVLKRRTLELEAVIRCLRS